MEKTFKKGDTVRCDVYGDGHIVKITKDKTDYPIKVEFQSDNSIVSYTIDGRSIKDSNITLHHR